MPLFSAKDKHAKQLHKVNFSSEKELQAFVEQNLEELFHIKFLATEYVTSSQHGGRIDSLGLDENGSPVIIEYKWGENSAIINQGLFYLDWLVDHQGDFRLLVQHKIGKDIEVDFGAPRLLLIASSFTKYDTYAINRMAENIELWSYSFFDQDIFELRLIAESQATTNDKKQISKTQYKDYSLDRHLEDKSEELQELINSLRERILALETDTPIQEVPRKFYIAYKTAHNFVCVEPQKNQLKLHLALDPNKVDLDSKEIRVRNVIGVGHYGTGDLEVLIKNDSQIDEAMKLIKEAYENSI
ncbi:hypothetical protein KO465_03150 [Candidatus Micrarchaeota archaeon]|nr:hypothetical protein [Candidatus Micrarchaeota archaeon]